MERQLVIGGFYRHFKNKLYQVRAIAYHSETKEKMVVYQALYGDYSVYVRPYDMFMSEVDKQKYPDIYQKYRFEQVYPDGSDMPHVNNSISNSSASQDIAKEVIEVKKFKENKEQNQQNIQYEQNVKSNVSNINSPTVKVNEAYKNNNLIHTEVIDIKEVDNNELENVNEEEQVNPLLMAFLDAEDYQQKLNTLTGMASKLDDKLIDAMADSMEIEVPEGPIEKRYASLRSCIMTHAKFECTRLRN